MKPEKTTFGVIIKFACRPPLGRFYYAATHEEAVALARQEYGKLPSIVPTRFERETEEEYWADINNWCRGILMAGGAYWNHDADLRNRRVES